MKIQTFPQASDIWLLYKEGLQGYIFKYVQSEDLAEELVQQVLMKVYGSCCNGREIKNTRSWLFQIAHNLTIDYLKKKKNGRQICLICQRIRKILSTKKPQNG